MKKMTLQLILAFIMSMCGLILLFMGLWIPPMGEIDNSVLIAYGEISTFVGGLLGVDYNYKYKYMVNNKKEDTKNDKNNNTAA